MDKKIKIKLGQAWQLDSALHLEGAEVEVDENTYKSMKDAIKHTVIDKPKEVGGK